MATLLHAGPCSQMRVWQASGHCNSSGRLACALQDVMTRPSSYWPGQAARLHPVCLPSVSITRPSVVCQAAARRVRLIKQRKKLPASQRKRNKYKDIPRRLQVLPGTSEFPGRILTAINSANGPRQLDRITSKYGEHLPAQHISAILSRLAGFVTTGGLDNRQVTAVQKCADRCGQLLKDVVQQASPLELSRAAYSMYRLKKYDQVVWSQVVEAAGKQMSLFEADALAGLGAALGGSGHVPPRDWLDRYCLETYIRLPRFTAQDLANVLFGLASLGHCPSDAWLEAAQRKLREVIPVSGANAPALVKFAWALARLQVQPSFNWMLWFTSEVRQRIDMYTSKELATLAWACVRLKHTPDPLFSEAWYRAATRRLPTFSPPALCLALQSAAAWCLDIPPPGKFMTALLPHAQSLLGACDGSQLVALLWSCVNLRIKPDEQWMDAYLTAAERTVSSLGPAELADASWSFARLRYQPSELWETLAATQVSRQLPDFTPEQLGVLIWSWRSTELAVPPLWDQVFMAAATQLYTPEQLKDISVLLGILADSNTAQRRGAG